MKNYPVNLYDYYSKNPDFEERIDSKKRVVNFVLMAVCVLLIIFPSIIPIGSFLVRILAIIGLVYFGFSAFMGGKDWYNKPSGGKVTVVTIKKFAVIDQDDEKRIMDLFEKEDWEGLANESIANSSPLQIYIHENMADKTFYLQMMKYYSSSDFSGASEVKVIKEPQYTKYSGVINNMKSA